MNIVNCTYKIQVLSIAEKGASHLGKQFIKNEFN